MILRIIITVVSDSINRAISLSGYRELGIAVHCGPFPSANRNGLRFGWDKVMFPWITETALHS